MRRTVITLALCAAIAPASAAALFVTEYSGGVNHQPGSLTGFNLRAAQAGGKEALQFTTQNIAYTCESAPPGQTSPLQFTKAFPIEQRVFDGTARKVTGETDPKLVVHGELLPDKTAKGTLRLTGQLSSGFPSASCDTGEVRWRATKAAKRTSAGG